MKIKSKIKLLLSAVLVIVMLLSTVPAMLTASAATTSPTATSTAPNTEIFATEYFNAADFDENFKKWNDVPAGYSINDGVLSITEHSTTRGSAYMSKVTSLNQYVSATLVADTTTETNAVIWLRVNSYKRSTGEMVPIGYFVKVRKIGMNYTLTLYKSHDDNGNWAHETQIGQVTAINASSGSDERGYCDIKVDVAATYDSTSKSTAINVKAYKYNTTDGSLTLMNSVTYEDSESELQVAGKVGIAANEPTKTTETVNISAFAYHTTDNGVAKSAYSTSYFDSHNFWDNMTAFGGNYDATVNDEDGTLSIAGGNNNARDGAQMIDAVNLNQTVKATVKTPHVYDGDVATYTASNAIVWLRASTIKRANSNQNALYGYYITVDYNQSANATVNLYKQSLNDAGNDIVSAIKIVSKTLTTKSSNSNTFNDVTVEATVNTANGVDTIDVHIYKGDYHFESLCIKAHTETDVYVQKAGCAGLSAGTAGATFTSFSVSSNDDIASGYVEENSAKTGVLFGQVISINPASTYKLSVLADGDFTNEPLVLSYNGCTAPLEFTPNAEGVVKDGRYNKYTYTIAPTNATVSNNSYIGTSSSNVKLAAATVGFYQKDATKYNFDLTGFELREVKADGSLGANLLVNSDFKMGFCAWSDDVALKSYQPNSIRVADDPTVLRSRVVYHRDTNNINFATKFAIDNYADYVGDANCDGEFDIRDLVCIKTDASIYGDYNIYADMNLDGKINAEDIVVKIKEILEKK